MFLLRHDPLRLLFLLGTISIFLVLFFSLFNGFVYDDSYIAFRFSDNWGTGKGLQWNEGEDPVEGFTCFSWVLIGALIRLVFGVRPHVVMPTVGVICWIMTILVVIIILKQMLTTGTKITASAVLLALVANLSLGFHAGDVHIIL